MKPNRFVGRILMALCAIMVVWICLSLGAVSPLRARFTGEVTQKITVSSSEYLLMRWGLETQPQPLLLHFALDTAPPAIRLRDVYTGEKGVKWVMLEVQRANRTDTFALQYDQVDWRHGSDATIATSVDNRPVDTHLVGQGSNWFTYWTGEEPTTFVFDPDYSQGHDAYPNFADFLFAYRGTVIITVPDNPEWQEVINDK